MPLRRGKKNRSNHKEFMTEKLRQEGMARSRLSNKYNENRTYENDQNMKQRNIYTNILKNDYFNNVTF